MTKLGRVLDRFWRRFLPEPAPGAHVGQVGFATMTLRRVLNVRRLNKEYARGASTLAAKPTKLVIEATNVCNLHCPGCFTGLGENGRVRSAVSLEFYNRMLDELGDTLIEVEFYNWGEPFLCKSLIPMIEAASKRGIATLISTNFSVPFDEAKAEALVKAGLSVLGVSLDGATQENYEQYRRGGNLEQVLRNAQMVLDAKQKLGASHPKMIWSFHVFEHNVDDVPAAQALAKSMGFDEQFFSKGFTYGREWEDKRFSYYPSHYTPIRCNPLWFYAVIHNDGGVAPCCGSFYHEDDLGRISVAPGQPGVQRFSDVWNNEAFRHARALFADKEANGSKPCGKLCDDCPQTETFKAGLKHSASGAAEPFQPIYSPNDGHNYFYNRRPSRDTRVTLKPERAKRAPVTATADAVVAEPETMLD